MVRLSRCAVRRGSDWWWNGADRVDAASAVGRERTDVEELMTSGRALRVGKEERRGEERRGEERRREKRGKEKGEGEEGDG